jgi:carbon storage regulator
MLTLTRRIGERILVGNDIEITVLDLGNGKVRLGVRAPRSLPVHRGELVDRIESENRAALVRAGAAEGSDLLVSFPEGLFGLRHLRSFAVYDIDDGIPCRVLVAEEDPSVRLLVVDAATFFPDYPLTRACTEARIDVDDAVVGLVVTLPADGGPATANLLAPLVISVEDRTGVQVILESSELPTRAPLEMPSSVSSAPPAHASSAPGPGDASDGDTA